MAALDLNLRKTRQIASLLKEGKVGVIPTDTIYGLVGSALNEQTVERIYALRQRDPDKPMIILISDTYDLVKFGIVLTGRQKNILGQIWPNPVSIILVCSGSQFEYLHRGKKSLAFRVPQKPALLYILRQVGPLVAPSANIARKIPAENIKEAKGYFADQVDFYVDSGNLKSKPSTIAQLYEDGTMVVLRQGGYKLSL